MTGMKLADLHRCNREPLPFLWGMPARGSQAPTLLGKHESLTGVFSTRDHTYQQAARPMDRLPIGIAVLTVSINRQFREHEKSATVTTLARAVSVRYPVSPSSPFPIVLTCTHFSKDFPFTTACSSASQRRPLTAGIGRLQGNFRPKQLSVTSCVHRMASIVIVQSSSQRPRHTIRTIR
jgi:hypothetical protein